MPNQDTTIVVNEPLFYGSKDDKPPKDALSPETFIERVDELGEKNTWSDAQKASNAMSFLRGGARNYFADFLRTTLKPAAYETATKTYDTPLGFKIRFKKQYYTLGTVDDLTLQWTKFRQDKDETATRYAIRCITEMGKFTELIKHQPPAQLFTATVPARIIAAMAASVEITQDWTDLKAAMALEAQIAAKNDYKEIVVKKLIAGGMTQTRIRELVQKEDRKGTELLDIVDLIDQEEKRNNHNNTNVKPKTKQAHSIGEETNEDDEEDASAVNLRKSRNQRGGYRGNNRGFRGNQNRKENRIPQTNPVRQPCSYCGLLSHTLQFCFSAPQEVKDAAKAELNLKEPPTSTSSITEDQSHRLTFSENF